MGIFNEILEGQLNQLLARRLAMQTGAPAPALQPEVVPALVLENDRPEWAISRGEGLFSTQFDAATETGEQSWMLFENPLGTNIIVTITAAEVACASTILTTQVFSIANATLTGGLSVSPGPLWGARYKNQRFFPRSSVNLQAGSTVAVTTALGAAGRFPAAAAGRSVLLAPIVLYPGSWWAIYNAADDDALSGTITWRERVASGGELV